MKRVIIKVSLKVRVPCSWFIYFIYLLETTHVILSDNVEYILPANKFHKVHFKASKINQLQPL